MARVRVTVPDHLPFETLLKVRITDLNYSGHLGNDKVLSLMHEARAEYLRSLDLEELNLDGTGTIGIIMTDVVINFKAEGFFGDEIIAEVGAGDFEGSFFDFFYRFTNRKTGKVMVLAKTNSASFDYSQKKVVAIPNSALKKLSQS